jgi:hypothetical protein
MNDKFDELAKELAQSRRLTLLCLAVWALSAVLAPANEFRLGPVVDLSDPDALAGCGSNGAEKESSIAANPANPKNLVAVWWGGLAKGIVAAVTFDAGKQWQQVVIPGITLCTGGSFEIATDPWLSFAPNGDLYAVCQAADLKNGVVGVISQSARLVTKSADGGLHWSDPITLDPVSSPVYADKPSITADPQNADLVYATWQKFIGGSSAQTMFSRSTDGGRTWEAARSVYDPGPQNRTDDPQILVLPDGTLVNMVSEALFQNKKNGGQYQLFLSVVRSLDKGRSWSAVIRGPQRLTVDVTDPDTGHPAGSAGTLPPFFNVACDPVNGNLYAVWEDSRFGGGLYSSIALASSGDGGSSWSVPIQINQTPTNIPPGNQQAFLPTVAVASDGTVGVAYYDFRFNDPAPGLPTDYWLVHCHPSATAPATDPANWGGEVRLTDTSFDMETAPAPFGAYFVGDYEGLATVGYDFLAAWAMPHGGDPDSVFFRRVGP